MRTLDWAVAAAYGVVLVGVGLWQKRRAEGGVDDFFASGRRLRWWAAGTSMIAASFASDTPLLVTSLVRTRGLWGNWQWWGLGISHVFTIFFFARLWRRSEVITEAELTEMRYGGRAAAVLRGFKAIYWGLLFNAFTAGAWSVTGLAAVTKAVAGVDRTTAILVCAALGGLYATVSGLWGVVAADMLQFVLAIAGAVLTAVFALGAAGGLSAAVAALPPEKATFLPLHGEGLNFCLTYLLVQWWAWKNTDGGGVLVQRMAACRDEREAVRATLWYAFVHYALRCWPWVMVAVASMVVLPAADPQEAYGLMVMRVLPAGLRGLVVAWFFAEFMASIAGAMNWGGSLVVNDFYRRFLRRDAGPRHYVAVARLTTLLVMAGAVATAFLSGDIAAAFGHVLLGTSAVGVVFAARWLWWRVNAWSEIAAMLASPAATFLLRAWSPSPMVKLLSILGISLVPVALATFLTRPDAPEVLEGFCRKVRPPGPGWRRIRARCPGCEPSLPLARILLLWVTAVAGIYATTFGIGSLLLLRPWGWAGLAAGALLLTLVVRSAAR